MERGRGEELKTDTVGTDPAPVVAVAVAVNEPQPQPTTKTINASEIPENALVTVMIKYASISALKSSIRKSCYVSHTSDSKGKCLDLIVDDFTVHRWDLTTNQDSTYATSAKILHALMSTVVGGEVPNDVRVAWIVQQHEPKETHTPPQTIVATDVPENALVTATYDRWSYSALKRNIRKSCTVLKYSRDRIKLVVNDEVLIDTAYNRSMFEMQKNIRNGFMSTVVGGEVPRGVQVVWIVQEEKKVEQKEGCVVC